MATSRYGSTSPTFFCEQHNYCLTLKARWEKQLQEQKNLINQSNLTTPSAVIKLTKLVSELETVIKNYHDFDSVRARADKYKVIEDKFSALTQAFAKATTSPLLSEEPRRTPIKSF